MAVFDMELLGQRLSDNSWNAENGDAAGYQSQGHDYRTWRPTVTPTQSGGLFLYTIINHVRGGPDPDDICVLQMEFGADGQLTGSSASIDFRDLPVIDTDLVSAAAGLYSTKAAAIAKVAGAIYNSLYKAIEALSETGGRKNFPNVVRTNLELIAGCVKASIAPVLYNVTVFTGDVEDAGTDAGIFVTLTGTDGASREVPLGNARNNFERNSTDGLSPRQLDENIGDIREISVRSDGRGEKPGWFLEQIKVLKTTTDQEWNFRVHRWLAVDGDDGQMQRSVRANTVRYDVAVLTANIDDAGTDASVYLTMRGTQGTMNERKFVSTGGDIFERGREDTFTLYLSDLGRLRSIVIRSDGHGDKAGWRLQRVTVTNRESGATWVFDANVWLEKNNLQIELKPAPSSQIVEGDLVRIEGDPAVYLIKDGIRRHVPDMRTLASHWAPDWVTSWPADRINQIPEGPALRSILAPLPSDIGEGDLIKCPDAPEVYLLEGGDRHWIPDDQTRLEIWPRKGVKIVAEDVMAAIPEGWQLRSLAGL